MSLAAGMPRVNATVRQNNGYGALFAQMMRIEVLPNLLSRDVAKEFEPDRRILPIFDVCDQGNYGIAIRDVLNGETRRGNGRLRRIHIVNLSPPEMMSLGECTLIHGNLRKQT